VNWSEVLSNRVSIIIRIYVEAVRSRFETETDFLRDIMGLLELI
jgi:hypothetical protein